MTGMRQAGNQVDRSTENGVRKDISSLLRPLRLKIRASVAI